MMIVEVAVSSSECNTSSPFQLHPWSIAWFILALNDGTSSRMYGLLKTYDETLLLRETTAANSLTTSSPTRPSKNVNSISKRDTADW